MRILIVDDSSSVRMINKKALLDLGQKDFAEAADGMMALEIVASQKIDLVLLDWNMPMFTGIDVLKQMKKMPATKTIPVIMVTSESHKHKVLEALQAGASGYIVKPYTKEILAEKLSGFIKVGNGESSAQAANAA